ncbi:hypothetical protein VT52_032090 [Streptomyces malaysiense]|uniref:Uncharacterized protein n=1 Tax=Streptomyces malaysiense TaxID=1428626 RepID=A0A1J4PS19_9ACTN|nr:hypothetical protein VT52_032090 [Streptomyces malaysiense]
MRLHECLRGEFAIPLRGGMRERTGNRKREAMRPTRHRERKNAACSMLTSPWDRRVRRLSPDEGAYRAAVAGRGTAEAA